MKKKLLSVLIFFVGIAITYVIVAVVFGVLTKTFAKSSFLNPLVIGITIVIVVVAICWLIFTIKPFNSKRLKKINNDLEDSHWLSGYDRKNNENLTVTTFKTLSAVSDGIPIQAFKKGKNVNIILAKPIHTLVIGTTGSGKSSTFVSPAIQIWSRTKTQPSILITDPKGELLNQHEATLKKNGYKTFCIDLDNIFSSIHWNPFAEVILKTKRMVNKNIAQYKGKYLYDDKIYLSFAEAENDKKIMKQQLIDEIYIDLQDIIYTICPIENKNDSTWQKGARDLIFAIALAMWEDYRDGFLSENQFCLYNLYKTVTEYASGECDVLKEYINCRDKFSKTKGLANTVLVSQDKTLSSYLGDVNQYMNWLADSGIASLTSKNDFDLTGFDEEPIALFLRIPEERENRHKLVSLFITQLYKALVYKANQNFKKGKTQGAELLRNAYFLMDEFGNIPKIYSIDRIITVGRSRKIFFIPVIQDYRQLDNKYGKEIASIVKSNSNIKIFIGSTDQDTIQEFSSLCGKHKVRNVSFSEQKDISISTRMEERPLIYPSELQKLNDPPKIMGNAIVLAYGKNPLRAKFTPAFKIKNIYCFEENKKQEEKKKEYFDETKIFYDIQQRIVFSQAEQTINEDFSCCESENENENNGEVMERLIALEIIKLSESIDKKIKDRLLGKMPKQDLQKLLQIDIEHKLIMLNKLIRTATNQGNKFLMFDLIFVKNYIINMINAGEEENERIG